VNIKIDIKRLGQIIDKVADNYMVGGRMCMDVKNG